MNRITSLIILLIFLTACATPMQRTVSYNMNRVDRGSITDQQKYDTDYQYCCDCVVQYQSTLANDAAGRTVGGALLGAAFGAAIGGILGGGNWAGTGAALGAVSGAGSGLASTPDRSDAIFWNCMKNRGYNLLW